MHISETTHPNFIACMLSTAVDRSWFVCHRCDTLCTTSFVNDVMFSYNGPHNVTMLQQQHYCNVVHARTPLLRRIGCILSQIMIHAKDRRVLHDDGRVCEASLHSLVLAR